MSVQAITWAAQQICGGPLHKLLLMTIADWAGDATCCAPSSKMCDLVEALPDKVMAALSDLSDLGLIVWNGEQAGLPFSSVEPVSLGRTTLNGQRARVFARDGWACVYCGATELLSIDHVHPRAKGGTDDEENLVTACRPCNSSKGSKLLSDWKGRPS